MRGDAKCCNASPIEGWFQMSFGQGKGTKEKKKIPPHVTRTTVDRTRLLLVQVFRASYAYATASATRVDLWRGDAHS